MAVLYRVFPAICVFLFFQCSGPVGASFKEPTGPYDAALMETVVSVRLFPRAHNNILALEHRLRQAQTHDMELLDSLGRTNGSGEHLPYIHAVYQRIKSRQEVVQALLPLKSRRGYVPDLLMIERIPEMEQESRRQAANYFYEKAETGLGLSEQYHSLIAARSAADHLDRIRKYYYPHWRQMDVLRRRADTLGTSFVLIRLKEQTEPLFPPNFEEKVLWITFHASPRPGCLYDYEVHCRNVNILVAPETTNTTTRTEEKKVKCGEKVERDTAGRVIKTEEIYRTEQTVIYTCETSRTVHGQADLVILRHYPADTIAVLPLKEVHTSQDSKIHENTPECPASPSHAYMEGRMQSCLRMAILREMRTLIEKEYP